MKSSAMRFLALQRILVKINNVTAEKKPSTPARIIFILIIIVLSFLFIEGSIRLVTVYSQEIKTVLHIHPALDLDEYEIVDPDHRGNWLLKPGMEQTLEQTIEGKKKLGRVLALQYWNDLSERLNVQKDDIVMRINRDGFKGPEIDRLHSGTRILTIGDSCTFGTFDRYSYPRVLERSLRNREMNVEVINAGVEGYAPVNVLARIDEFKALRPEVTTIYIGWNALYYEHEFFIRGIEKYLYTIRLLKKVYRKIDTLLMGRQKAALEKFNKEKNPDINDPEIGMLDDFTPSFMANIEKIVQEMQSIGSRVIVVTIPGLYIMEEKPTEQALKKGHLPSYTNNPYVLAKIGMQYNRGLKKLAAKYDLPVIDLEGWSKTALPSRDEYFFDSVHLYEKGQEMIGMYMAKELSPYISDDVHR
jgi:lysophospholipase L1-like esterase